MTVQSKEMKEPKRGYFKWGVNEILTLQREYELLEMDVGEIADNHQRSVNSIVHKLVNESFIDSHENARGFLEPTVLLNVDTTSLAPRRSQRVQSPKNNHI